MKLLSLGLLTTCHRIQVASHCIVQNTSILMSSFFLKVSYIGVCCCEGGALLGDHCDGPRLCEHTSLRNVTRVTRPCTLAESYVTRTNSLLVQHQSCEGTALHPANFRLKYEFVDTWLGGEPWPSRRGEPPPPPCSRVFRKLKSGEV